MIFNAYRSNDGCNCAGCGQSPYEGVGTVVVREDGRPDVLMVCVKCLMTGGISEEKWNKFLGKKDEPKEVPMPEPIKPRWFSKTQEKP